MLRRLFGSSGDRAPARVELLPDQIWISSQARLNGIRAELQRSATDPKMIALVAHFPDMLAQLEPLAAEFGSKGRVRALLARQLSSAAAERLPLDPAAILSLIVAERHPLRARDAELLRFAEALPCRSRIVHHLSLEDPLFKLFGSERIRPLLGRLGASETEPIEHALITRSIEQAQRKIEAECSSDYDADSAAAWLERNRRVGVR
ncbi:MAG TPA: hypothetical protein VK864_01685 [Longimicrobiales bacterium]|nr:hypothetical protein [Longimicrobiales bacterium]